MRAAILVIGMSAGAGCAGVEIAPPSLEVRAQLGVIGVVAVPGRQTSGPKAPVEGAGSGALMGAGQGALASLVGGAAACYSGEPLICVLGLALGVALAPPAALIGGVVGASRAHPAEEVQAADASLRTALAETELHQRLRDRLVEVGRERTPYTLLNCSQAKQGIGYRTLAAEGVDSVLEVDLADFRIESDGRIDPDLTVWLDVRARLLRTADHREVYRRTWRYRSHERGYFDMAADAAKLLRSEIREGYEKLADQMIRDLFIATTAEKAGRARDGTVWTVGEATTAEGTPGVFQSNARSPAARIGRRMRAKHPSCPTTG